MEKELLGIDEAGRGPVIGPMVIAGCVTNAAIDEKLQALGVKDSKMIAPKKRDLLFEVVKKSVLSYEIIVVSPQDVDAALNNPDLNLNKLEALTSAKIINAIVEKYDGNFEVMIDSPTNTPKPSVNFVEKLLT
ncbi:MAG: ribonuclease HII, partial [Candidatus Woesearchaeota archaeon]